MKHLKAAVALAAMISGTAVYAQDDFSAQLKARQGQMRIMAINLGLLGGMAQGKMDYNAEAAQAASSYEEFEQLLAEMQPDTAALARRLAILTMKARGDGDGGR